MDIIQIVGFTLVVLLLVMSPGPNGLLIAKTVPTEGKLAGFANIGGFVGAFIVHGVLSILGISVILTQSAEAFLVVKILGAVYLAWVGIKSLISAVKLPEASAIARNSNRSVHLGKAFLSGFLTNVLNPKVSMFYLAAFPQFIPLGEHALGWAVLLVSIHAVVNVLWFTGFILLCSQLSKATTGQYFQRALKAITGVVFIGFGAKLLTLESR